MDINRLAGVWRERAERHSRNPDGLLSQGSLMAYLRAANELERAWHEHAHDGAWDDDCTICDDERAGEDDRLRE